jgi:UBX domain-containing protein 1
MVVQDPNKKHIHREVEAMFERVRRLGAQEGFAAEPRARAAGQSGSNRFFSGSSHTLTGETRGPQVDGTADQPELRASPPDAIVHNIHFWQNGFTVDEGPLRRLDDPANLPFLEARYILFMKFHNW